MKTLKKTSKGKEVLALQKLLNKNGAKPKLEENSVFDDKTEAAVKAYQQKAKTLKVDGVYGPNTEFELTGKAKTAKVEWPIKDLNKVISGQKGTYDADINTLKEIGTLLGAIKNDFTKYLTTIDMYAEIVKNCAKNQNKRYAEKAKPIHKQLLALQAAHTKTKATREKDVIAKKARELEGKFFQLEGEIGYNSTSPRVAPDLKTGRKNMDNLITKTLTLDIEE